MSEATPAREEGPLGRADRAIYAAERAVVGALMAAMALVVFLDVLHRVFTRSPGRLSVLLGGLLGQAPEKLDALVSPLITVGATLIIVYGGIKGRALSKKDGRPISRPRILAAALALTAALTLLVQGFVRLMPEGIVWAPYFSLCVLLWSGMIGASMATYASRHLALEMGEKLWPSKARPVVRAIAQIAAGVFCFVIAWLAAMSAVDHLEMWLETPEAALIPSVDIPKWMVFGVIPYSFGMIAIRFIGRATRILPTPAPAPEFDVPVAADAEEAR